MNYTFRVLSCLLLRDNLVFVCITYFLFCRKLNFLKIYVCLFVADIQEFYELTLLDETKSVQEKTAETIRIANKWETNDGPIATTYVNNDVSTNNHLYFRKHIRIFSTWKSFRKKKEHKKKLNQRVLNWILPRQNWILQFLKRFYRIRRETLLRHQN